MVEQHAHGFGEAIGALRTNMVHDLIEQAMVVLVGVDHFGFVLFAKASKPIWPAPATPPSDFSTFLRYGLSYAAAYASKAREIGITERLLHRPLTSMATA